MSFKKITYFKAFCSRDIFSYFSWDIIVFPLNLFYFYLSNSCSLHFPCVFEVSTFLLVLVSVLFFMLKILFSCWCSLATHFIFKKETWKCSFKALCPGTWHKLCSFIVRWFVAEKAFYWRIITWYHCLEIFSIELFYSCSEEASLHMGCGVGENLSVYLADFNCVQMHASLRPSLWPWSSMSYPFLRTKGHAALAQRVPFCRHFTYSFLYFVNSTTNCPFAFQLPQTLSNLFFTIAVSPFSFAFVGRPC